MTTLSINSKDSFKLFNFYLSKGKGYLDFGLIYLGTSSIIH